MTFTIKSNKLLDSLVYSLILALLLLLPVLSVEFGIGLFFFPLHWNLVRKWLQLDRQLWCDDKN